MNKSPATTLAESIAADRVKQKPYPAAATETVVVNKNPNELVKVENNECLNLERDGDETHDLAENPEKFWKAWSQAHAKAVTNCSSKECSCFEGIGSVM